MQKRHCVASYRTNRPSSGANWGFVSRGRPTAESNPKDNRRGQVFPATPARRPIRLDQDGWSCYDHATRAFIRDVHETGLRRLLSDDVLAGAEPACYTRHRFAQPTTVSWTLLDAGDAECIRSEVSAGHHGATGGLLLNRAIELLPIAAAMPETALPARQPTARGNAAVKSFVVFVVIGPVFATVAEVLTIVVLRRAIPSDLFALRVLFPNSLSLVDDPGRILDQLRPW